MFVGDEHPRLPTVAAGFRTHIGLGRKINEDAFVELPTRDEGTGPLSRRLWAVADGMGVTKADAWQADWPAGVCRISSNGAPPIRRTAVPGR